MRPFLHKDCISKVTKSDLISVINHHGTTGGGHYVCHIFEGLRGAYVLFYRKWSQEMIKLSEKTVELLDISSKEPSDLNFFVSRQWINRFNTFAKPRSIDDFDFLCPHGEWFFFYSQFFILITYFIIVFLKYF